LLGKQRYFNNSLYFCARNAKNIVFIDKKSLIKEMKKYEKPSIKEMKLDIQPILAGSNIQPSGPIGEGW
jgi:hypothetical protein